MWVSDAWKDYELIDSSRGERLERWGRYVLIRPDPQVIWTSDRSAPEWKKPDASYRRRGGGGAWEENALPERWTIGYRDLRFIIAPGGFKHTGLFPEQAANWDWFSALIRGSGRPVRVLNLFAYTGGATVAAAAAGATVCHVDAAKGMVQRARENAAESGLADAPIRYIVDDVRKFLLREKRRGSFYEAVIMDPPSYGRGPGGEVWKLEDSIEELIRLAVSVLSDAPLFFLLNSYSTGLSPLAMRHVLAAEISRAGFSFSAEEGELALKERDGSLLPCGGSVRVTF